MPLWLTALVRRQPSLGVDAGAGQDRTVIRVNEPPPLMAKVDASLARLEAANGGAVLPIRWVPLDLLAAVVAEEMVTTGVSLDAAVATIVRRNTARGRAVA